MCPSLLIFSIERSNIMISEHNILRIITKHNLSPLQNPNDPRSSTEQVVREMKEKGFSNFFIAIELGMAESTIRLIVKPMQEKNKFHEGDRVEFADFADDSITQHGVVLDYLEPSDGFLGGYHVACYFVVSEDRLKASNDNGPHLRSVSTSD